jgi:hypothetical protein
MKIKKRLIGGGIVFSFMQAYYQIVKFFYNRAMIGA